METFLKLFGGALLIFICYMSCKKRSEITHRCPKCGTVVWLPEKKTEADLIALWNEYAEVVGCD